MRKLLPLSGAILMLAGTFLHPMHADPSLPDAAFAEYAADRLWLLSHLMQFLGVAAFVASLLTETADAGRGVAVSAVRAGAVAGLALAAALQAVDGVALKRMVDLWAAAADSERAALFAGALAIRSIEIGLAALFALVMGLTLALFGMVVAQRRRSLGLVGVASGLALATAGVMTGAAGFTPLPMMVNMAASVVTMGWYVAAMWSVRQSF